MSTTQSFTCDTCRKQFRGTPLRSATGRELCSDCHDSLLGLAAGSLASGGDVGTSIATAGWFARLRKRRS